MLTAEGQHFICPLNMGYIPYKRVILSSRGIFLPEKRVLQDMISCPSAVNKCPFRRTYYSIFGKECFIFGYIICCPFRMKCLAPYTVPLGPSMNSTLHCFVLIGQADCLNVKNRLCKIYLGAVVPFWTNVVVNLDLCNLTSG